MASAATDGATEHTPLIALLTATAISLAGSRLTLVAIPWFVLQTTGDPARVGLTAFAGSLAYVLAALLGGALVDRVGFRAVSVYADIASGLAVGSIPLLYRTTGLSLWQLLSLVFLGTFCNTPGSTARQGLLPDLAARAGMPLERANASVQAIRTFAQLVGPVLAGLLIALIATSDVLWLDAATFIISAVLIGAMVPATATSDTSEPPARRHYLSEMRDGFRFLRQDRLITTLAINSLFGNFLGGALFGVVLPVYARANYGKALGLGLLLTALGGGGLLGTLLYGVVGHRLSRRSVYIGSLVLSTLARCPLIIPLPIAAAVAALAVSGFGSGPGSPIVLTTYQERVPAALRGRVFGAIIALNTAADPLALLATGYALASVGLMATIICLNGASLLVCAWVATNRVLRAIDTTRMPDPATIPRE